MNQNETNKNRERIFAVVGVVTIFVVIIFLSYRAFLFILNLPGFSFDPISFIAFIVLINMFRVNIKKQNEILEVQTHLLTTFLSKNDLNKIEEKASQELIIRPTSINNNLKITRKPKKSIRKQK